MGESLKCNFSPRKKDYSRREYATKNAEMSALFSVHKKNVKKKEKSESAMETGPLSYNVLLLILIS